jgi:hypothetical protein
MLEFSSKTCRETSANRHGYVITLKNLYFESETSEL